MQKLLAFVVGVLFAGTVLADGEVFLAPINTAYVLHFTLLDAAGLLDVNESDGGTDVSVACDTGAEATATNDFTDRGSRYSITIAQAEMNCAIVSVFVAGEITNHFTIQTYGAGSQITALPAVAPGTAGGVLVAGNNLATTFTGAAASGATPATAGLTLVGGAASTTGGGVSAPGFASTGGAGAATTNGAAEGFRVTGGGTTTVDGGEGATFNATGNLSGYAANGAGTGNGGYFLSGNGATGTGVLAQAQSTNGDGWYGIGNGTGSGGRFVGGATGNGWIGVGGATSGHGVFGQAATAGSGFAGLGAGNNPGASWSGQGTAAGTLNTGGATGEGQRNVGGATSGAGQANVGTAGNSAGTSNTGQGSASGQINTGGTTGNGQRNVGGATSGAGVANVGTAGNSPAVSNAGQGSAAGVLNTGGATGEGQRNVGGATSGAGQANVGTAGNSAGQSNAGQGSAAGLVNTGGATGPGVSLVGGATSGAAAAMSYTTPTCGPIKQSGIINAGTLQSASGTTAVLCSANGLGADDSIVGATLTITQGTGFGQSRPVLAWVDSTETVTVDTWVTNPDNTSEYELFSTAEGGASGSAPTAGEVAEAVWNEDATGHQTQGTFGQAIGDPAADTNTIFKAVVTDAVGATVGVDVTALVAVERVFTGTADSGTVATLVDAALTESATDYWAKNLAVVIESGSTDGQTSCIAAFTPGSDTITLATALTAAISTNQYVIIPAPGCDPFR